MGDNLYDQPEFAGFFRPRSAKQKRADKAKENPNIKYTTVKEKKVSEKDKKKGVVAWL
ncbi:MAG: hypothetical protein ACREBU_00450 [Nitrososphaera sp.]